MTDAMPYTLLSPARYAKILGITPPHFFGAAGTTVFPAGGCNPVFFTYAWQNQDAISRYDIIQAIQTAEEEIAQELGFWPGPVWIEQEVHRYPQHHRRDVYQSGMGNVRQMGKSIKLDRGRFIQAGRRAVTVVSAGAAVVYSDDDGDGYKEVATVTAATTLTDECELKVYHAGYSGQQEWEIRPARSVTIAAGVATFKFDAWLLLDPDLQQVYPTTANPQAINLEAAASYVTTVDVYREYTDFTQASAVLYWEPTTNIDTTLGTLCPSCGGAGCTACTLTSQDGCLHVRDVGTGWVVPTPATYDSTTAQWDTATLSICRDPDLVKAYYYAGDLSREYLAGRTCDPLGQYWAEAIAWLATARLERKFCTCGAAQALAEKYQQDMSFQGDTSHALSEEELSNPFGTHLGEIMAWRRVHRLADSIIGGAV